MKQTGVIPIQPRNATTLLISLKNSRFIAMKTRSSVYTLLRSCKNISATRVTIVGRQTADIYANSYY